MFDPDYFNQLTPARLLIHPEVFETQTKLLGLTVVTTFFTSNVDNWVITSPIMRDFSGGMREAIAFVCGYASAMMTARASFRRVKSRIENAAKGSDELCFRDPERTPEQ